MLSLESLERDCKKDDDEGGMTVVVKVVVKVMND